MGVGTFQYMSRSRWKARKLMPLIQRGQCFLPTLAGRKSQPLLRHRITGELMLFEFRRPLIVVAHPDDEALGCAGLLQRMASSLVVFTTDGAPPHHGFERQFGTLQRYSETRFQEAAVALRCVSNCTFQRLTKPGGTYFVDQRLFHHLPEAFDSLCQIARRFSPDALVSHAYEGGHIDHDTCCFLARYAAAALSLPRFEFPLYSMSQNGPLLFQQFRDPGADSRAWQLTETEVACKQKMLD